MKSHDRSRCSFSLLPFLLAALSLGCGGESGPTNVDDGGEPPAGWIYHLVDVDEPEGEPDLLRLRRVRTDGSGLEVLLTATIETFEVSRDGTRLYTRVFDLDAGSSRLLLMDATGPDLVDVSEDLVPFATTTSALDPERNRILFIERVEGVDILRRVGAGGVETVRELGPAMHRPLSVSPHAGGELAMVAHEEQTRTLLIVDANGASVRTRDLEGQRTEDLLSWSPDGSALAFVLVEGSGGNAVHSIALVDAATMAIESFVPTTFGGLGIESVSSVRWADGGRIVVSAVTTGGSVAFFRMNPDGTGAEVISAGAGGKAAPSPDGTWVAFERQGELWVQSIGNAAQPIDVGTAAGLVELFWTGDG